MKGVWFRSIGHELAKVDAACALSICVSVANSPSVVPTHSLVDGFVPQATVCLSSDLTPTHRRFCVDFTDWTRYSFCGKGGVIIVSAGRTKKSASRTKRFYTGCFAVLVNYLIMGCRISWQDAVGAVLVSSAWRSLGLRALATCGYPDRRQFVVGQNDGRCRRRVG